MNTCEQKKKKKKKKWEGRSDKCEINDFSGSGLFVSLIISFPSPSIAEQELPLRTSSKWILSPGLNLYFFLTVFFLCLPVSFYLSLT